jgi:Domain of unknown function (DUF1963)
MTIQGPYRTLDELGASLASTGVSPTDQRMLLALALPSIALQSKAEDDDDIPLGASKIGGAPDLPRGVAWPSRLKSADGLAAMDHLETFSIRDDGIAARPAPGLQQEIDTKRKLYGAPASLAFLLQVDLSGCANAGTFDPAFPREGRLLVFYDLVQKPWSGHEEDGNPLFTVVYDRTAAKDLVRAVPPDLGWPLFEELVVYANRLPAARLTPVFTFTLPDDGSEPIMLDYMTRAVPHKAWLDQVPTHLNACNRLGGWPENIQGDMPVELAARDLGIALPFGDAFPAAAKRLRPQAQEWVQVLQIGDYDNKVMDFDGLLHIWIKREDLRARDFAKARLIFRTT